MGGVVLSMEYKEYRIKDIVEKVIDNRGRNTNYYDKEEFPIIDNFMIKNELYPDLNTANRYLSREQFNNFLRGYIKKNDLLITLVGNGIANVTLAPNRDCAIVQNTIGLSFDKRICCDYYMYYYFLIIRQAIQNLDRGSSQPSVNREDLLKLKIYILNLSTQQKIGNILSAYDELIEKNNRKIEILEQEAEELYKEWFVRFRFPCHETTHFENGLPQGWEYKSIKDFIKFERGVSYSSEEIECENGVNLVNLKNINSYGGFNREGTKKYNGKYRNTQTVQQGDLVLGITDMTQERRTVGSVALIPSMNDVSVISADLLKIVSQIDNSFIYCVCRYGYYSKYFSQFANGANVLHLRQNSLNNKKILLPTASIIELFVNIVNPLFKEIDKVQLQNELLKQQRDLLLPRLMSGKLEVSTAENVAVHDKFDDVREHWKGQNYDANNFGIAARSNGKISEETLQTLKDIAEEDD